MVATLAKHGWAHPGMALADRDWQFSRCPQIVGPPGLLLSDSFGPPPSVVVGVKGMLVGVLGFVMVGDAGGQEVVGCAVTHEQTAWTELATAMAVMRPQLPRTQLWAAL